jgi:hypothetical protein
MPVKLNNGGRVKKKKKFPKGHSCPLCERAFQVWPIGWDGHAEYRCPAVARFPQTERKSQYKRRVLGQAA